MTLRIGIELTSWTSQRGYGRFTRGLVTALLERDDPIEYVFFVDSRKAGPELPRRGSIVPLPLPEPRGRRAANSSRSLGALRRAGQAVAAHPVDILFFPSVHAWLPVRTAGQVLLGIHDVIAEDHPGLVFPRLADRWRWRLKSAWARRGATAILTVSDYARDGLVRRFGLASERIFVVEEAPAREFRPLAASELDRDLLARCGLVPGEPVVAYLGGVNPHKNLAALVDAVMTVRRRPGLESTRLLLVGDIVDDTFTPGIGALREHVRASNAGAAVTFAGFLPDAAVAQVLNSVTLLALPSWAEGFGLPAVEAAACGTPVVATERSPLPQLLAGGGLFVDPARPDQLAEAIGSILAEPELRARLAVAARARAAQLTWSRAAERFISVVERLREAA